jgi:hypothetical protein
MNAPRERRRKERRHFSVSNLTKRARRRIHWIIYRATTQAVELILSLSALFGAVVIIGLGASPVPVAFGYALVVIGLSGLCGLLMANNALRLFFSFTGTFIGAWLCWIYASRDWHDPAWVGLLAAAAALYWVMVRVRCVIALHGCGIGKGFDA